MWFQRGKPFKYPKSQFDHNAAKALIGKRVLIGKTYKRADGTVVKRTQEDGVVVKVRITNGICIQLDDSKTLMWLPPDMSSWQRAAPGTYTSQTTGKIIEDPDYMTTWTVDA